MAFMKLNDKEKEILKQVIAKLTKGDSCGCYDPASGNFPDVKKMKTTALYECHETDNTTCKHSTPFGFKFYCLCAEIHKLLDAINKE
jgi:hypothetical protein